MLKNISYLFILSIIFLTGCQTQNIKKTSGNLAQQQHWKMKARVAIKTPEDNVTATLDWQKQNSEFDFHLYGLFGVTYAQLIQEKNKAILNLPEDRSYTHSNAQQLLYQSLGWDFPIDALTYWVKGLPSYHSDEQVSRNQQGQIEIIQLNDWTVTFKQYQSYSGYVMPRMIKAIHPQMSLKVVVKDWEFLP